MNSSFPFMARMRDVLKENLFTKSDDNASAVATIFLDWLTHDARLKPSDDLQKKIVDMEAKLRRMGKSLDLSIQDGKLVIKADAESEALLNLLRRGSDWFDPHPDVNAAILLALVGKSQFS